MRPRERHNYNFRFRWLALAGNVNGCVDGPWDPLPCNTVKYKFKKYIRVCGAVWRKQLCLPLFSLSVFTFYFLLFRLGHLFLLFSAAFFSQAFVTYAICMRRQTPTNN